MAATTLPADVAKAQLTAARIIALKNPSTYLQIVPPVMPIIGTEAALELRRWGADFLAETFASPSLALEDKTQLALTTLPLLKGYLDKAGEDEWVVKSTVQAAASCYPLVFRYIIDHPTDVSTWQIMAAIKSNILRRMDGSPAGVHVCCIKFVQRVVQTQTPGLIADARHPEHNELSLALVPRDHPLIPPPNLEAEASGLLDRLLGILQENSSDALLVTATMNCLGSLIRYRASIANKILNTILSFNPLKLANAPMTPRSRVLIRSMERTTKALLLNVIKRNANHPLGGRIQQYLERLHHSRTAIFDDASRKRAAPAEPIDGLDNAKRQRLGATIEAPWPPPLPPPPVTIHQLFTLTADLGSSAFHVESIPADMVVRLLTPLLQSISQVALDKALNAVRARYLSLANPSAQTTLNQLPAARVLVDDDDDDYEPDYAPMEDAEQINNRLDQDASAIDALPPEIALGPLRISTPPPLTDRGTVEASQGMVSRMFGNMDAATAPASTKLQQKSSVNRVAARANDRDVWITISSRLAARAPARLDEDGSVKKEEAANGDVARRRSINYNMASAIREGQMLHLLQDWRRRIGEAISWLNEQWYEDKVAQQAYEGQLAERRDHFAAPPPGEDDLVEPVKLYEKLLLRTMDGVLPYLDAKDTKILLQFLSEVPELPAPAIEKVKKLCNDPERVQLATLAIQFVILFKQPVKEIATDALEDLWRNYPDAKTAAAKLLTKYRPHVLQEQPNGAGVLQNLRLKDELASA